MKEEYENKEIKKISEKCFKCISDFAKKHNLDMPWVIDGYCKILTLRYSKRKTNKYEYISIPFYL